MDEWPYDADRDDPLTGLRIAVVGSAWPRWAYIVSFDPGRLDDDNTRPTDHEALLLQSFLNEYIGYWYNDQWKTKMAERPFDIDGGANGITFRKWGDNDWAYHRRTWSMGPTYVPEHPNIRGKTFPSPLTLIQLMDRIHTVGDEMSPRWITWKNTHPDLFGNPS